ncbi:MAG: DUF2780 domain-containing protein [Luteitalea sp.]|nr:DUF2780 domain-containing protein [Luteitalea sp.]
MTIVLRLCGLLVLGVAAGAAAPPQDPATTPQPDAQAAQEALAVEDSASPELVGAITDELDVTPQQAQGGAGALLGLAKTRLQPEEFAKVASAVPGTDALLSAAPAVKGAAGLAGLGGGAMGLASLAGSFNELGLSPDMAGKMAPVLTKFVQDKGASEAASLLGGVLK